MRVINKPVSEITATDLQELTLLLLHQAKSPLVAVDGFISMAESEEGGKSSTVRQKLLHYARSSNERAMILLDTISNITALGINGHNLSIMPSRLDVSLRRSLLNYQVSSSEKRLICKINRTYKLPMVLVDQDKLEESLRLVAQIFVRSGPGKNEVLDVSFRIRGDYLVMRLSAPVFDQVLSEVKKVFLKDVHLTRLASEHDSELVVQCYIIRRNIELMSGFVKTEAKRGGPMRLYLHLPLSRQLQLTRLLGGR